MGKKKIAFVHYQVIVGGISIALLRLIKAIDHEKYDITLFLGYENGKFEHLVPDYVHVKYHYVANYRRIVKDRIKRGQIISLVHAACCRVVEQLNQGNNRYYEQLYYSTLRYPLCDDTVYECVVAFHHEQMETVATALFRLKAKKRVLWVHSEFLDDKVNYSFLYKRYKKFDKVICVSEALKRYFLNLYPKLDRKTDVIVNQIDPESIISKSEEKCPIEMEHPAILTVGHITTNKGSHLIPQTIDLLMKSGHDVHWYLVGDVHDDTLLQEEIKRYGVEDRIIFCGLQSNPYPFFRICDIYVQPSFVEGYGFTVAEARILCKPIVTTPFKTSTEQIQNRINGLIAKAHTSEALSEAIAYFLDNCPFMKACSDILKAETFNSKEELRKLYDFIDSDA